MQTKFTIADVTTKLCYRPRKKLPQLCSRSDRFSSVGGGQTGWGIPAGMIVNHTFRIIRGRHLIPESYGVLFPSREAQDQHDYERGYLTPYYSRPCCWYGLRLSPASRKFLQKTGKFYLIPRMLGDNRCNDYDFTCGATSIRQYRGK